jgi:hypothetical protein
MTTSLQVPRRMLLLLDVVNVEITEVIRGLRPCQPRVVRDSDCIQVLLLGCWSIWMRWNVVGPVFFLVCAPFFFACYLQYFRMTAPGAASERASDRPRTK